jgi:CheY-like chemotaxis protein
MSLGKPKLLVVEDDPSTRSSLDRVFREVGYDVKRVSANRQTTHRANRTFRVVHRYLETALVTASFRFADLQPGF